ncbi:MAG: hypothetical protein WCI91_00170 [Candidatus Nomurabacteria bacterium]
MKIIIPILFIVIAVLAFIFGVNPWYNDVNALRAEILDYNTALNNSAELLKAEDSLIGTYNGIKQSDKDRLSSLIPSSVNNIQFILEVERIANLHNMPIKDLKFEASRQTSSGGAVVAQVGPDDKPYGVFPLEFSTEGTYDTFVLFLKDLEYNLRLVDVKSISFTVPTVDPSVKITDGLDPNVYKYSVKVETYWLK